MVYTLESFDQRTPLWIEHDPQHRCSRRPSAYANMKANIESDVLCEPLPNDARCVSCTLHCQCPCTCFRPPIPSLARARRSRSRGPSLHTVLVAAIAKRECVGQ